MVRQRLLGAAALTVALATGAMAEDKVVNVYNWSDYIAEDTIPNFQKETGIKVRYDVYDSNETLEAKLFAGNTYRDVTAMAQQIFGGVGFTLEYEIQLYFRRAKQLQMSWNDTRRCEQLIAAAVLDDAA